jgi:3-hydroxyisobutyrate dehydrogenase-like beta-hydroxyacid dehydrogenase
MRIAFLGLGQMGTGIAALMVKQGHDVTAWNRTPKALEGATVAASAAEAVRDAEAVFSMLFGDQAVDDIFFGEQLLDAIPKGAIHVGLSTISVALAGRLHEEHSAHGQHYVGSPVFGRPSVAAEGKLWIIVAGAGAAITTVRPVLEQFSRGITVLGEDPSSAHALKLGGNFLITAMIAALSEGATYAEGHGIDAATYLEAVNSALFQSPFYAAYSKVMLNRPRPPGPPSSWARRTCAFSAKAPAMSKRRSQTCCSGTLTRQSTPATARRTGQPAIMRKSSAQVVPSPRQNRETISGCHC